MGQCIHETMCGRCNQIALTGERCYYHQKIHDGLVTEGEIFEIMGDDDNVNRHRRWKHKERICGNE